VQSTQTADVAHRFLIRVLTMVLFGLAGCGHAPLGRSVDQEIVVETPGCAAARCELRNDKGRWVVEATPGRVRVSTSDQPLELSCSVPEVAGGTGRAQAEQRPVSSSAAAVGAAVGGGLAAATVAPAAVLGGPFTFLVVTAVVIGAVGGGSIARAADASQREFAYPAVLQVPLQCAPESVGGDALARSTWGLAVRGASADDGTPSGAVRVTAVAPGGRAAAAGLQTGDLLLALDGRPLAGTLDLEDSLRAARGPVVLLVRRAADLLQLTLPFKAMP